MKNFNLYLLLSLMVILGACESNDLETENPDSGIQDLQSLSIPDGFNFETERAVSMTINDETWNIQYDVYGYSSRYGNEAENIANALNNLIYTGKPTDGVIKAAFSLSNAFDKVYIIRRDGIEYTYEIRDVNNNVINFTSPLEVKSKNKPQNSDGRTTNCGDCTQIWTNGDFEDNVGDNIPPANSFVQVDENLVDGWFTTADDLKIEIWDSGFQGVVSQSGGSHAELNATQPSALYQRICTTPNAELTWSVWHRGRRGVDVATVKIGETLLTATTVETMSTGTTDWVNYSGTYTVPAGQLNTFLIFEAVSAVGGPSIGNFIDNVVVTETSPGDPCGGGTIIYPGGLEPAYMAFEDLWPSQGDYDFNDLVVRYRVVQNLDEFGFVEEMDYFYNVTNVGASYRNGFAVELPGIPASAISGVTGQRDGLSGVETGANGAVIRFFKNAQSHVNSPTTLTILFNPGMVAGNGVGELGTPPYNPFLTENEYLNLANPYEVHLPEQPYSGAVQPNTIPGFAVAFAQTNDDLNGDYKVEAGVTLDIPPLTDMENMPWAINIAGTYVPPLPGVFIMKGHLKFQEWAQSGGVLSPDWFLDLPGNRDNTFLDN